MRLDRAQLLSNNASQDRESLRQERLEKEKLTIELDSAKGQLEKLSEACR
jgi:hypothetical protein